MKSFTLIELIISVVIFFLIGSAVVSVFNISQTSFRDDIHYVDLQQRARNAINGMTREIRQSSPANVSISSDWDQISFLIPGVTNSFNYSFVNQTIVRQHPTNVTRDIVTNVSNVTFCVWKGSSCCDSASEDCTLFNEVLIDLTLSKTVMQRGFTFSLTEKVRLRNE
ncbi:MAG: hypothetical protein PHV17_09310 [Candidatus Omnitrophica bacterium]|nr:hypothetical protein [Candidatus Omnitrophota bacterium]